MWGSWCKRCDKDSETQGIFSFLPSPLPLPEGAPNPSPSWTVAMQPSQFVWRVGESFGFHMVPFWTQKIHTKTEWKNRWKNSQNMFKNKHQLSECFGTSSLSSASKRSTSSSKTGINLKPKASKRAPSKPVNGLNINGGQKKTDFPRDKSSCSQMELSPGELNKDGMAWTETMENK